VGEKLKQIKIEKQFINFAGKQNIEREKQNG